MIVPESYDYVGVFLTDQCHLKCPYCITRHHGSRFGSQSDPSRWLSGEEWAGTFSHMVLPDGIPITVQGGEPFLHPGIWNLLNLTDQKIDILTALPDNVTIDTFMRLKSLEWNRRPAPYPTIRVSYHKWQQNHVSLIQRIAELKSILSIGLFVLGEPIHTREELDEIWRVADEWHVECRIKEFLGEWKGQRHGDYRYPEAVTGKAGTNKVWCKNTVAVIGPDAKVYRCHSDLYFGRKEIGNLRDRGFEFLQDFTPCDSFGFCSTCDVKIKTNRFQEYPYTSVEVRFEDPDHKDRVLGDS